MSALPRFDSVYVTLGNRTAFHPLFSNLFVFYAMPCILEAFVVILKRKRIKATFSTAQGLAKMRGRGSICYGTELYVFGCRGGACARPHGGNMRLSLCSGRRNKTPLFRAKPSFWVLVDLFPSADGVAAFAVSETQPFSLFSADFFSLSRKREKPPSGFSLMVTAKAVVAAGAATHGGWMKEKPPPRLKRLLVSRELLLSKEVCKTAPRTVRRPAANAALFLFLRLAILHFVC